MSCRRQAPAAWHANPMLMGGSDDEAARTNRLASGSGPTRYCGHGSGQWRADVTDLNSEHWLQ